MIAIAAVDSKWGIGRGGNLLFSLPEDMKFFRRTTLGKVIIVGRKTLETFPSAKPLSGRTNVVLTSKKEVEGALAVGSIEALMCEIGHFCKDDVFVCGGETVYRQLIGYCDRALVTKVEADGGADAFFPDLDKLGWRLAHVSEPMETGGYTVRFTTYENPSVKVFAK